MDAHIVKSLPVREVARAMKALSDETRLRMLNILMERECCVCEVMQALEISQTRASRNLNILHNAGFLRMRKDGLWSLYSIDHDGMEAHFPLLLEAVKRSLQSNEVAAYDRQRLKKSQRIGPGCVQKCLA
jgi:ArsR family transcriptional regulator